MEEVAKRLTSALLKVASNKGAPGPDGQTSEALADQWPVVLPRLQADLLGGTFRPGVIRRAFIPKAGGGQRGLGIPDVIDRVVCEAVRQVLEPLWEPTFHPSSHGFRPGRSCHTAITEAGQHVADGYEWCVDLDLEKFFDLVCHQRLVAKLAERVGDRRLLVLIGRMLKAKVVLPDGVVIDSEQGVPQGSPLSPLLSNIVLDELDRELARRGHQFTRYADRSQHRPHQMVVRQPLQQQRRQQERLVAIALDEVLRHPRIFQSRPDITPFPDGHIEMELSRGDGSLGVLLGVQAGLAMRSIASFGFDEQKRYSLPPMPGMEALGAFALTEPEHGSDSVALETSARREGDEYVIGGSKRRIGNGSLADVAVVWARETADGQVKAFLVERGTPG